MTKPLIGICTDHVRCFPQPDRDRSYLKLYPTYANAVIAAGGTPLVIPVVPRADDIRALLDLVQGVILVGGDDYPPEWYGKTPLPTDVLVTPERASFDREFTPMLYEQTDLPVLGVCGGMQMTAIWAGGTLLQHIGEGVHRDGKTGFKRHKISIDPASRFAKIIGATEIEVNSQHHQAIESVAGPLVVSAKAPDGVIEAIEFTDHPWRIGLQWHPERMTDDARMQALFQSFVAAAAARINVVA
ncbi:MAG: gamma-glutamyl-gamma-aminobutyrate hydrolase family protein [Planctomycetes bacterium]|nr:gamma-glutamyl-gamma-aminobutyrate hydrolase family protein [Planctomycetota bacterium]